MSISGKPTRSGGPSASPTTLITPLMACRMVSLAGRREYSPSCPKPEIVQ